MASKFQGSEPCYNLTTLHQTLLPHLSTLPSFFHPKDPLQSPLQPQHNVQWGEDISADAKRLKEDYGQLRSLITRSSKEQG
ncbi:hypothetical protein LR48_Vigan272s005600 [Vigna angularis]|uniref:Uncharacterized protein n=1 Tax=Phaseolus angularis TaxID=3914 RepID=A0A0L9T7C7_PHAAN|nr:hypothetical protein LR48_Vigan272s005600 [Vigna angularis]